MSKVNLSVIVPAYNCEKSICKCIDSILSSQYIDYEIIIINDASIDTTKSILCEKYSHKNNIIIINLNKNQGVSYCRNIGIEKASGNYITFVDSDDYITSKMYSNMMHLINEYNLDCCICDYVEIFPDGSKQKSKYHYKNKILNNEEGIKEFFIDNMSPSVCDKIFRTTLLRKNRKFENKLRVGEDILFVLNFINTARSTYILDEIHYHYVQQEKSTMHTIAPKLLQFTKIEKHISKQQLIFYENKFKDEYKYFKSAMLMRGIHSVTSLINKVNIRQAKYYLSVLRQIDLLKVQLKSKYTNKFIKLEVFIFIYFGINIHILLSPIYVYARKNLRRIR